MAGITLRAVRPAINLFFLFSNANIVVLVMEPLFLNLLSDAARGFNQLSQTGREKQSTIDHHLGNS